jgi:hypothetical protein
MKIGFGFSKRVPEHEKEREVRESGAAGKAQNKSETRNIADEELESAAPRLDDREDFDNDPFILRALKAPKALQFDPKDLDTRPMSAEDMMAVLRDYERLLKKS